MPLPNRVTPFATLVAVAERGTLMGNRGRLHDAGRRVVRHHAGQRWISCLLEFRGRREPVWAPGRYSQLFFLDEATALAAGHRPCAQCRHADVQVLRRALGLAPGVRLHELDERLAGERSGDANAQRTHPARADTLPAGTMIALSSSPGVAPDEAWLVGRGAMARWSPSGYGPAEPLRRGTAAVLTPPTLLDAIRGGYPVPLPAQLG